MSLHEKVAHHIVTNCLKVKRGEHVLITGGVHQFDLLSRISIHVKKNGGYPTLSVSNDEMYLRTMTEVDEDILLAPVTDHEKYIAGLYDAAIHIDAIVEHSKLGSVPGELLAKIGVRDHCLRDLKYQSGRRSIAMSWPTEERAKRGGLSMEEMEDLFWKSLLVDMNTMKALNKTLEDIYSSGNTVRITSEKGSDISFIIKDRRVMVDGGAFEEGMVEKGDRIKNLPCGEVYTTAIESTPEGVAIFDEVFLKGCVIENLKLVFKKGKIIESSADANYEAFASLWDTATGDKDQIAEFAIGTNPEIKKPVGDSLFDEKIFGSVHLAIGENTFFGGSSSSSIHWDLVMQQPTVIIDEKVILDRGMFKVSF